MLKKARKERLIWLDIMMTLMALALMSYFYYGVRSAVLCGICVAVSLVAEIVSLRLMGRHFKADDLTCTSDALILALMLPACMDYSIAVIASVFAVVVAKNVFGGRKNMIFSPAAAAYVFALTSWGSKLLMFPEPHNKLGVFEKPDTLADVPTYILVPSYILHELTVAFKIGVILYIPFIIIDMVVASILMAMGMMMLPPVQISMPFKLILFVLVDGWGLLTQQLFNSVIR